MTTKGTEKLNNINGNLNLSKTYNWIEKTFSALLGEALNEFWEMDIDYKLVEVNENQGFFFTGSEYFVTRVKLTKEHQFVVRLSKETVQIILDMALGYNPDFEFEKITELEAKILTAFGDFIYEKFSGMMLSKEEITDVQGDCYLTYLLKDLTENPSKIIVTIPNAFLMPEKIIPSEERFGLEDFPEVKTEAGFYVGSTILPLSDVKNLEKEDIIVLENSNINNMTLNFENEKIGFKVSPDPSLIISFNNNEDDKDMGKSDNIWDSIMVDISAEFDSVKIPLGEIKQISEGLVVDMGSLYENKVYLKVENKVIAEGELVIINDRYGVKVDKVIDENHNEEPVSDISADDISQSEEEITTDESEQEIPSEEEESNNEEFDYKDFEVDDENI